ncbi:hypothetical protein VJ918_05220 [Adlercreutzia sp. R21]|uniref:Uncharacterized protein n=1 Tax=Adlercreutzia wanghongyangiae TaxID=3111451 RepID=A0ABU6IF90_9ACTN|nr:hypothetical protein [Adlercreutzia sp. R21]MEC4175033.1 hypothetical protein [Adlercreutzia sp. R7]MEC4184207.1 hypothetical protein [Adlercreutzia sp. R21]
MQPIEGGTIKADRPMWKNLLVGALAALVACSLCGCYHSSSTTSSKPKKQETSSSQSEDRYWEERQRELEREQEAYEEEMRRLEESTPEAIAERLGIPQSQLWYNAGNHIGETCTIAGPVVNVYQARDANGMPIFVDIGAAYPSDDRVTLVIWAEHYDDFAEMLNAVDHGGAWLSVTSYLDVYEGSLQMNSDNGCDYTWWTEVE